MDAKDIERYLTLGGEELRAMHAISKQTQCYRRAFCVFL